MGQGDLCVRWVPRLGRVLLMRGLALPLCSLTTGAAQVAPASQAPASPVTPGYNRPQLGADPNESNPLGPANAARLDKLRQDERRKRLIADTEKLVSLTGELKEEVAKASKDELSLDVVRKAAEIEKLAHDVKERMKS